VSTLGSLRLQEETLMCADLGTQAQQPDSRAQN